MTAPTPALSRSPLSGSPLSGSPRSGALLAGGRDSGAPDDGSSLRVGVDLVAVDDVAASVEKFGARYLRRIFTDHEIDCCTSGGLRPGEATLYSFESLAARFAAKEAAVKVLRPVGPRPEWRSIEVRRSGSGWCQMALHGQAAAMAAEAGLDEWAVSLTHEASMAAAVVVAVCRRDDRPVTPGVSTGLDKE